MLRRVRGFSIRNIGVSQRDLSSSHGGDDDASHWVPAPKGIAACVLFKNKNEALGRLTFKYDASSFHQALEESRDTDKPVVLLFQAMHGAPDAIAMGKSVLSHPLLIEAAESLFITVIVDIAGTSSDDAQLLARYHENGHHGTVIRIVNCKGHDLAIKLEGSRCSVANIARAMRGVLDRKGLKVPKYLKLLEAECNAPADVYSKALTASTVIFKTKQSAKAEIDFAELKGVVAVECGKLSRSSAVRVTYNPDVIDCKAIFLLADSVMSIESVHWTNVRQMETLRNEFGNLDAPPLLDELGSTSFSRGKDPKHFLRTSLLRYVPLTSLQALRANLAISKNEHELVDELLSPRQLAILEAVETRRPRLETVDVEILDAWMRLEGDGVFEWS
jgi:hypothetical protein